MNPADRPRTLQLRQTRACIHHRFTNGIGEEVGVRWRRVKGAMPIDNLRDHAWFATLGCALVSVQQHRNGEWLIYTRTGEHRNSEQPADRDDALLSAGLLLDHMAAIGDRA